MDKIDYNKPPLTIQQQINLLKNRNLLFYNENKAFHLLSEISYYRLSAYFYPLLEEPKEQHQFKTESYFEDAFNLYCFDRELRQLIFNEIEKIEISFRSKIIYYMSHEYGAFWFENKSIFFDQDKHNNFIDDLKKEIEKSKDNSSNQSKELSISSYYKKYINELPPSWISLEIITLGQLSRIYSNILSDSKAKNEVANLYNLSPRILTSWMHCFTYLRNICAHHSRLWNKQLGVTPLILPNKTKKPWLKSNVPNNKVFFVLSMIYFLIKQINPNSSFKNKLKNLISKYPKTDKGAMGFPLDWEKEPLWIT